MRGALLRKRKTPKIRVPYFHKQYKTGTGSYIVPEIKIFRFFAIILNYARIYALYAKVLIVCGLLFFSTALAIEAAPTGVLERVKRAEECSAVSA